MSAVTMTPPRSVEQRARALLRANEVRSRRAEVKRDLRAGRVRLADLLADPPDWLATARVYAILLAAPKVGKVSVDRAFRRAGVSTSRTFAGITLRQVEALRAEMRGRL